MWRAQTLDHPHPQTLQPGEDSSRLKSAHTLRDLLTLNR